LTDLIVVDTDVLVDAGREIKAAIDILSVHEETSTLAASIMTYMELVVGCRNKRELNRVDRLIRRFEIINFSPKISEVAINLIRTYRLSHGLLIPDALIAATAIAENAQFISKNQRDYRFIKGLRLLPYG